ncbi:MAG: 2-hydroxyacid dehydrogenase [Fimbriimonadaceae bacterium]
MNPSCFSAPGAIVVTEGDEALARLFRERFGPDSVHVHPGLLEMLGSVVDSARVVAVTVRSPIGPREMDLLPNVELIVTGSAGYDHIDLQCARAREVKVCNVPDYGPAVAEFNMALILALSRRLHHAYARTREHDFGLAALLGRNLAGRTLGIIGTGHIGAKVADLAAAFGTRVVAADPNPRPEVRAEYMSLDGLLSRADVLAICCPLTDQTRHMIGREEFQRMKRGMLLVNTSRGPVVDTQALLWALEDGIVEGAALDVLEGETLLAPETLVQTLVDDPTRLEALQMAEGLTLAGYPKVLVTPHIAYYTIDSLDAIREVTVENVAAYDAGSPQNLC